MSQKQEEFVVTAESWFDGEKHHREPATFLVKDGRIAEIAPGDHSAEFAGHGIAIQRGAFLMPGLVDAHVHLFLDGAPTDAKVRSEHLKQPLEVLIEAARNSARQNLACGVTCVRDAGDRHSINHRIRNEAMMPASQMARVRSGGVGLKRPKRYGAFMAMDVATAEAVRSWVSELSRENDEIKLILTGIIDFEAGTVTDEPQFDVDAARLVVETARAHGRNTFAHCSGVKGLEVAVEATVASIEHGFFMNREILGRMAERGIAWTPTFSPVHFQWAHPEAVGRSAQTVGNLRRILDEHARHLAMAQELGVTLLLGTDAGSMGVQHGYAVGEEIERYLEAGLSLATALQAATKTARRHFGMADTMLARGAAFEALLLDASPFEDLKALRRPRQVWPATLPSQI